MKYLFVKKCCRIKQHTKNLRTWGSAVNLQARKLLCNCEQIFIWIFSCFGLRNSPKVRKSVFKSFSILLLKSIDWWKTLWFLAKSYLGTTVTPLKKLTQKGMREDSVSFHCNSSYWEIYIWQLREEFKNVLLP